MNPSSPALTLPVLSLLATAAPAQVAASLTALAPIAVTASEPGLTVSDTRPIGPLPSSDYLNAGLPSGAFAAIGFAYVGGDASASAVFSQQAWIGSSTATGTNTAAGPAEFLLEFQCPTQTYVWLSVTFDDSTVPGSPQPAMLIDVGNDGIFDFVNGIQAQPLAPLTVGPVPLSLRVWMSAALQQIGQVRSELGIAITPRTDVHATPAAIGCALGAAAISVTPTFLDQGVRVGAGSFVPSMPFVFVVFGWGTQPLLLPSNGAATCLLVPTVDVVVPLAFQHIDVPLPPAVRPITFWVQGVLPDAQLLPTDCLRIDAM